MTYNSAKVARVAIAHIIIGGLLVCLGIALRVASTSLGQGFAVLDYSAIWIGIWMCVTGGLGIYASRKQDTSATVFTGFAIISALLGVVIIIYHFFALIVYVFTKGYAEGNNTREYDTGIAMAASILILGIVGCVIAGLAISYSRKMSRYFQQQEQQMVPSFNTAAYVMNERRIVVPMSVPVQGGVDTFADQDSREPGGHLPEDLVPVSKATEGQVYSINAASAIQMQSTGYPYRHIWKPPTITYV